MDFVDRMTAADRAVGQYRRFAQNELSDCAFDMIVDLLHWHGRFCIPRQGFNPELAGDMVLAAHAQFEREFAEQSEAESPLMGRRRNRMRPLEVESVAPPYPERPAETPVSWDEVIMADEEPPIPFIGDAYEQAIQIGLTELSGTPLSHQDGWSDNGCNCSDCMARRRLGGG